MGGDGSGVFAQLAGHEQVAFWSDPASGLRAVVAIHSTALGPALGGTRFYPYATEAAAVADVLDLSRAMTYKAACAGLDLGGGKAVIIGDPARDKSEPLLRSYGRFVQSLGGRYITACDVGTYVEDMDVVARESDFVTGRSPWNGGAGDSSVLTAVGVHEGMRAVAEQTWGEPSLSGRTVGISGVGKVGRLLAGHLVEDGAKVLVTDVSAAALDRLRAERPEVVVLPPDELARADMDVYAPCALGHALTAAAVRDLSARAVCGGANNQLATPEVADLLLARGIEYAPDYVVNAGGIIQVAEEVDGYDADRAEVSTRAIFETTRRVLTEARAAGVSPVVAADRMAEERIARVGGLRRFLLPRRR